MSEVDARAFATRNACLFSPRGLISITFKRTSQSAACGTLGRLLTMTVVSAEGPVAFWRWKPPLELAISPRFATARIALDRQELKSNTRAVLERRNGASEMCAQGMPGKSPNQLAVARIVRSTRRARE